MKKGNARFALPVGWISEKTIALPEILFVLPGRNALKQELLNLEIRNGRLRARFIRFTKNSQYLKCSIDYASQLRTKTATLKAVAKGTRP